MKAKQVPGFEPVTSRLRVRALVSHNENLNSPKQSCISRAEACRYGCRFATGASNKILILWHRYRLPRSQSYRYRLALAMSYRYR